MGSLVDRTYVVASMFVTETDGSFRVYARNMTFPAQALRNQIVRESWPIYGHPGSLWMSALP